MGILSLLRRVNRHKCLILMYHGVSDQGAISETQNASAMHLSVEQFSQQLSFLSENYNVIALSELINHLIRGDALPPYSVAITFDDGYENNYTKAFPVLQKYGMPATIFLSTLYVGNKELFWPDRLELIFRSQDTLSRISSVLSTVGIRSGSPGEQLEALIRYCKTITNKEKEALISRLEELSSAACTELPDDFRCLTWQQVREMYISKLVDFGSHTNSHVILTRVDHDAARNEIEQSRNILRDHIGVNPLLFSYPNGGEGDFDDYSEKLLAELGFNCALLTIEGFNDVHSNPYQLKRMGIYPNMSLTEFEAKTAGFLFFLEQTLDRLGLHAKHSTSN